jgi:hypothetical protein
MLLVVHDSNGESIAKYYGNPLKCGTGYFQVLCEFELFLVIWILGYNKLFANVASVKAMKENAA